MPPELAVVPAPAVGAPPAPRPERRLRVVDVALFYGDRSGGIRTYLDAKAAYAAETGELEHHLIVPGPRERHEDGLHELRSLRVLAANGYRFPLGARSLKATLRLLRPDVVVLHDPFWWPVDVATCARHSGALTVSALHGTSALEAASLPGPSRAYEPLLRAWLRRAASNVDVVMANVDARQDCGRPATLPLALGLDVAFRPQPRVARGDHVVFVGRLSREKGVLELLDAAARAEDPWPLRFVGSGPLDDTLRRRAEKLGLARRVSFRPYVRDPYRLARIYAGARCVVVPGEHETFGLVALEAAASGAPVAVCASAPAAAAIGPLGHTYAPGDHAALDAAIAAARSADRFPAAAAALGWRFAWDRVLRAELESLRELRP